MEGVEQVPLDLSKGVQMVKDVFLAATERDIYTGDMLKIMVVTKDGTKTEDFPLRRD